MNVHFRFEILFLMYLWLGCNLCLGSMCSSQENSASVLKFCTDVSSNGSTFYIDSSNSGVGNVNCSCNFNIDHNETIYLIANSFPNMINDVCKRHVRFEFNPDGIPFSMSCSNVPTAALLYESGSLEVTLLGEQTEGGEHYCIKLDAASSYVTLTGTCYKSPGVSTEAETTLKQLVSSTSSETLKTIITEDTDTKALTGNTEIPLSSPLPVQQNASLKVEILVPAIVGGIILIAIVIGIVIICKRRQGLKSSYEEPRIKRDAHCYENQAVESDDEMRDNVLYHSHNVSHDIQDNVAEDTGGYDEVYNPSDSTNKVNHDNHDNSLKDVGPVYSVPDKKRSKEQNIEQGPVYSVPVKNKNGQDDEGAGPVYAMPDKKNKKGKQGESENSYSYPQTAKLNYASLRLQEASNLENQTNLDNSDKTGYAEIV